MKLIDKEALLLALKKKRYSKQSLDLIESQPVVDAVPVDYMKQWAKDRTRDNWFADHSSIIARLIVDWEYENEKDI